MSRMAIYYNSVGIGDVLLIPLKQGNRETTDFRKFGDVVEVYDTESNQINGYNIFNSSTYIELSNGTIYHLSDIPKIGFINNWEEKYGK